MATFDNNPRGWIDAFSIMRRTKGAMSDDWLEGDWALSVLFVHWHNNRIYGLTPYSRVPAPKTLVRGLGLKDRGGCPPTRRGIRDLQGTTVNHQVINCIPKSGVPRRFG